MADYTDLNALAQRVHKANEKWWQHPVTKERIERNNGELLMLVITEIAEACEGERKDLMDDKLPNRKMAEVEMADAVIRLLDYSAGFKLIINSFYVHESVKRSKTLLVGNKGDELLQICDSVVRLKFGDHWIDAALAKIIDYCKHHEYDLWAAFEEKMAYNATREDHKHEARMQADGKKW